MHNDYKELEGLYINDKYIHFPITVKDFLRYVLYVKNGFASGIIDLYEKYNINFDTAEEFEEFEYKVFEIGDRFDSISDDDDKKTKLFDMYADSDLIYADFLKTYPSRVKCIQDIQDMLYFEFIILLNGISSNISDRVSLRSYKPKADEENKRERLLAQRNVKIWDNLTMSYDTLNKYTLDEMKKIKENKN